MGVLRNQEKSLLSQGDDFSMIRVMDSDSSYSKTSANSANETPREASLLALPLALLARLAVRAPITVIAFSVAFAIAGGFLAIEHLKLKTSRVDLINPESSFNRLWLGYLQEFGDDDEVIVVVSGEHNAEVIPVLDALTEQISAHSDTFGSILSGIDLSQIRRKALHYLGDDELATINHFVAESARLTGGRWDYLTLAHYLRMMLLRTQAQQQLAKNLLDPQLFSAEQINELKNTPRDMERFIASMERVFGSSGIKNVDATSYLSPWSDVSSEVWNDHPDIVALCSQEATSHFLFPTPRGVIGLVMLRITPSATQKENSFTYASEPIRQLRKIVGATHKRFPQTEIGITGMVVIENDEMQQSSVSMGKVTLISFFGVAIIFVAGFGGFRHAFIAVFTLLVGFGWTMIYITLGVGHLNILSMAFGVILIGLGIDFGIHYVSRYLQTRRSERSPTESLVQSARSVGPGVATGALTSAAAFFLVGQSEFTGIAELGIISAGGVLLCCLAAVFLLPALIQLIDSPRPQRHFGKPFNVAAAIAPFLHFPRLILLGTIIATIFLATHIPDVKYDHNLLNLHAEGEESVAWERRLLDLESGGKNTWYALSIADSRNELLERKKVFSEKYPELIIEEIVSFFPDSNAAKESKIKQIADTLQSLPEQPRAMLMPEVSACVQLLQQTKTQLSLDFATRSLAERIETLTQKLLALSPQQAAEFVATYQEMISRDLFTRLHTLRDMASPQPPTLHDLPQPLVARFISPNGKHLMRIYTKADIWNMDEMEKFVAKVRDVDPFATGSPLQTYEASRQMQRGYMTAAFYAFIAVCLILMLDLRSIRDTLFALSPMLLGTLQAAGILGWLDIPLNPANMIALPLILGIGIDDGVHVVHDARLQRGSYRLSPSTATSILMTSLTTMIGFGALMLATHQGLQSLGRVLVIGVTCAMLTSLLVLPAFLSLWRAEMYQEPPQKPDSIAQGKPEETSHSTPNNAVTEHPRTESLAATRTSRLKRRAA